LYHTLKKTTFCERRHVIRCRLFTNFTLPFNHFQCHYVIVRQPFFCKNVDGTVAGNTETILHWCAYPRNSDYMTSYMTKKISCNVAPFFYHHSVVIQHLVSDIVYQTGYFL